MAYDRLDQKSGERCCDPQRRQGVQVRSERLEYSAHVCSLKSKADLDSEETEGEIPKRRRRLSRFLDDFRTIQFMPSPAAGERVRALLRYSRGVIPKRSRKRAVKCDGLENPSE